MITSLPRSVPTPYHDDSCRMAPVCRRILWTLMTGAIALVMAFSATVPAPALAAAVAPLAADQAKRLAFAYLETHSTELGLTTEDIEEVVVKNLYASKHNGITHVYLRQRYQGTEVAGAEITLSITADGRVTHVGHRLVSDLASRIEPGPPSLTVSEAMALAAADLGQPMNTISSDESAQLVYRAVPDGGLRLAWELELETEGDSGFCGEVFVDARDGEIIERLSWVSEFAMDPVIMALAGDRGDPGDGSASMLNPDSYQVFAIPKEYPDDGPRTIEVNPALDGGAASPFGWHDTDGVPGPQFTTTRGNNAFAYTDTDNNNQPDPGSDPDGGSSLEFLFPLDLGADPSTYRPAAVTNAFYWANVLHDVLWNYGFDEPAGSFQVNNYGRGGLGMDDMRVEVQDGGGLNNANSSCPPDGQSPRMQLYLWTQTNPRRDGALSSMIMTFLYAECAERRLVGGPNNVNCTAAQESRCVQFGWSDWMGLVMTADASENAATPRGVGTYVLGQPPSGAGVRPRRYSTDFSVNEFTYGDLGGLQVPNAAGTVWGTMLWEVYWELVDDHGFNPDIYGDWTTGGNNLSLQLLIDSMKLVPCNPGFVDARDAILLADENLTGGLNRCAIWRAFSRRGLGFSASQGSPTSTTDGTEAFDLPPACSTAAVDDDGSARIPGFDHALRSHPNPFNPQANLSFALERAGVVVLEIFDLQGRLVRRLEGGRLDAGRHEITWDGRGDANHPLASGEYVVRLTIDGETAATHKTMLVK